MSFACGAGALNELLVCDRRPRVIVDAVPGPPFGETASGAGHCALGDLHARDATRPADRREHPPPAGHPTLLFAAVEKNESRMRDADDRRQGLSVRVLDHGGARLGVDPLSERGGVAGECERARGARLDQVRAESQLAADASPHPAD